MFPSLRVSCQMPRPVRLFLLVLLATISQPVLAQSSWISTWTSAQTGQSPDTSQLRKQTVREIAHVSSSGNSVRVHLSNLFGTQNLVIDSAHVALRASGAQIVSGTDRTVTFTGRKFVSIAPGTSVVSDAVSLNVPGLSDIAVSLHISSAIPAGTAHPWAFQTNYIGSGNQTSYVNMTVSKTINSWPFLAGVDVLKTSSTDAGTVVAFGDSLTSGGTITMDSNHRWPDYLAVRLSTQATPLAVANAGTSGNKLLQDGSGGSSSIYGQAGVTRFSRDALSVPGVQTVIVLIGINDILSDTTADSLITGLTQLATDAHNQGLKIIFGTLTPFGGYQYYTSARDNERQKLNQWILNSSPADGVIDFDFAMRDPANITQLAPSYDSGDHLHYNDAGHNAMANAIDLTLLQ